MKSIDPLKKIILDANVIIHFCNGEKIGLLPHIFPNKMYVPDVVYYESLSKTHKNEVNNLFNFKFVYELEITKDRKVFMEYSRLKKIFGKGESACMAYCRYHNDVIGSSDLSAITNYCKENNIDYITTLDFLAEAFRTGKMDEAECDYFIFIVRSKGSNLPDITIAEYIKSKTNSK
jgi:predicted nucleic acid-binding protein